MKKKLVCKEIGEKKNEVEYSPLAEGSEFFGPKTNSCRDCMMAAPTRLCFSIRNELASTIIKDMLIYDLMQ